MMRRFRAYLGVLLKDRQRYRRALRAEDHSWLGLCNRYEKLRVAPDGKGVECDWQWTSVLHAPTVMPDLGLGLMHKAFKEYPLKLRAAPQGGGAPQVSFVIGHRGLERLPHLLHTLSSIAGQEGVAVECIVVEQSMQPEIQDQLPAWVRYVHTPLPQPDMPYCRAWAFNVGARLAQGRVLVLHDNDLPVPAAYARQHLDYVEQGFEVVNLKRFIFYFSREHTNKVFETRNLGLDCAPEKILQNAQGGGSLVITRDAYFAIGGMDESFIGWGGEDNEFWERASTRKLYSYGFLPLVHLWHTSQPGRYEGENPTLQHYRNLTSMPAEARITRLACFAQGDMAGPYGYGHRHEAQD